MTLFKNITRRHPFLPTLCHALQLWGEEIAFVFDFIKFKSLSSSSKKMTLNWSDRYLCLGDRTSSTRFDRHYVYHTAWAARILAKNKPAEHVDISSYLYFATLVSAFVPIRFYDYRPIDVTLPNLQTGRADLLQLPFSDGSIHSLSCMHVVEHIGLGRYGDPLDPQGDLKAISELKRVLAQGGDLLFVVPIGKPRIMFNAHRVYDYEQITEAFAELSLVEFTLIRESSAGEGLLHNPDKATVKNEDYSCGCFWFRKEGQ